MRTFSPYSSPVQALEARRLLAVTVSLDADAGLLHVMGDESNDQIDVTLQFGVEGPPPVLGTLLTVRDHGAEVYSGYFLEGQLTEVRVAGGYGDDVVRLINDDSPGVNTFVSGDHGKDTIEAFVSGRATPSLIHAGEGDDLITLAAGRAAREGYVVLGEGGNDIINGSRLGDILYGDNESVSPHSIPGDDVIRGGGGNDELYGGPGNDELYGGDGDDFLHGGPGSDILSGGGGNDMAITDGFDKIMDVEEVILTK